MCGICGILRKDGEEIPVGMTAAMTATLRHRGPDGEGAFHQPGISFGFTRLAIIDLTSASDQPILDPESGHHARLQRGDL